VPALILHGGAGMARAKSARDNIARALSDIASSVWPHIAAGGTALECAVLTVRMLEDNPLFNAGLGSKLQRDGRARLSAALMNGSAERFSGVINIEGVCNPILLAEKLQDERDRVLSGEGAIVRARELGLAMGELRTPEAIDRWKRAIDGECGTVGAVVLDLAGDIAAATSTGGRGMERIGRVSDSATVAGNFASSAGGVSCTGIGEDIVDGALAARLVSALDNGQTLESASRLMQTKMQQRGWRAGLIALDATGQWSAIHTTEILYWLAIDASGVHRFEDPDDT
jgi:L-asparaginase